jgi:diacylglycerol O-acyltransferase-1
MYYFLAAPTLVYEPDFPRTPSIRWRYLLKMIFSFTFFVVMMDFMVEQYIFPITQSSSRYSDRMGDFTKLLKLTIPNITVWLLMFAAFFHCWLNIMAEVLRFGDRYFYADWWNCTSMDFFWRTWNLPVHKWLVLHVYLPIINFGWSTSFASFMVFFISAIGHEVIISVPFHSFKTWAFWAMMSQMPLCYWTRIYTKGHVAGNVLFWASFMFGQANCILMYYKDFQSQNLPQ